MNGGKCRNTPAIGESILNKVDLYADVALVVRHHHESVDGEGYPDKLQGDEIPQLSKIIAVADAYNAMTSNRAYRDAMPTRVARLRLAQAVESQFDTSVVAAFEAILAGATRGVSNSPTQRFRTELFRVAGVVAGARIILGPDHPSQGSPRTQRSSTSRVRRS